MIRRAEHIACVWAENYFWRDWLRGDGQRARLAAGRHYCVARRIAAGEWKPS
jgi:hypothetical protein